MAVSLIRMGGGVDLVRTEEPALYFVVVGLQRVDLSARGGTAHS